MKRGISQEGLKVIACLTMVTDHIGAVFFPQYKVLRVIGRLAFPIYAFLLSEGVAHTRHPWGYGFRLLLGAVLAEVPFDYLFYGGFTWTHQSVMVTLLIAYAAGMCLKRTKDTLLQALALIPFALLAEYLNTDYGGLGVVLVGIFVMSRGMQMKWLLQFLGMAVVCWLMPSASVWIGGIRVPIQMFALLSMGLIAFYTGRKESKSRAVQLGFYLFYPAHLAVLLAIVLITG